MNVDVTNASDGVARLFASLRFNDEFRLMFADQVQRHFFNGGVFYVDPENPQWDPAHPERNLPAARYSEMADQIELPLVAESARWGDARRTEMAYTTAEWRQILDDMFTNWLPQRSAIVLNQFVQRGLYPELAAPSLSQHGGMIDGSLPLTIDAPGEVYFTLNGTDPRRSASNRANASRYFSSGTTLQSRYHP